MTDVSIYGPEYHKIQSVYLRDPANNHKTFLDGVWAKPEFGYLANLEWVFTEKVDGMNMRVALDPDAGTVRFNGKTDNAQIPGDLLDWLSSKFPAVPEGIKGPIVLYGEGYGPGIQKAGILYGGVKRFVLFDAFAGGGWLDRETLAEVAGLCGVDVVPEIGRGTLLDAIELTETKPVSQWGEFCSEGIVARPAVELFDRRGHRVITKIKCKDFA